MMNSKSKFPLGELLVEKGIITPEQLTTVLRKQEETGELFGAVLLKLGFVDEEAVFLPVVAGQFGVEFVNLRDREISMEAIRKLPPKFASYYKVCPIDYKNDALSLATTEPLNIRIMDEIGVVVNAKIEPILASGKDIQEAIRKYYGVGAETIDQMMGGVNTLHKKEEKIDEIDESDSEASISKFLNQILIEAYRDRATDIHIEPFEDALHIRYRVDGVLYDAKVPSNIKHFKDSINSRIKILSNLNIAEKRIPQDGRFKARLDEVELDLRVSFLPTPYGESVVLRILNTSRLFDFDELNLGEEERTILDQLILKSHGIVFLTGPTGSGKTTTMYSCLARINSEEKKIITIEDPIEYQLKGITQIQINPQVGLTFAQGLRSMLRHDPDVMMVGEVRDKETAEIAIQVALTGHLIFSTLHTNDAAGGVARLLDMGIEPFLITSTIECFIAQRLVRLLCPKCKQKVVDVKMVVQEFDKNIDVEPGLVIYEAKGCDDCKETGFLGREAIYEFLVLKDPINQLIMERADAVRIKAKAVELGMCTLNKAGWQQVKEGKTSLQEVVRVTQEEG